MHSSDSECQWPHLKNLKHKVHHYLREDTSSHRPCTLIWCVGTQKGVCLVCAYKLSH